MESDASDVANALAVGDAVVTVFEGDGHRVTGARVRYSSLADGHEGIETEAPPQHPGPTRYRSAAVPGHRPSRHIVYPQRALWWQSAALVNPS